MNLSLNQKAELDALVNFFGGKSLIMKSYQQDRVHRGLVARGLTRWGKSRGSMREHHATALGVKVAKRFKRDWSQLWADQHPDHEYD